MLKGSIGLSELVLIPPTFSAGTHDGKPAGAESVNICRDVSAPRFSTTPHDGPSFKSQVVSLEVMAAWALMALWMAPPALHLIPSLVPTHKDTP